MNHMHSLSDMDACLSTHSSSSSFAITYRPWKVFKANLGKSVAVGDGVAVGVAEAVGDGVAVGVADAVGEAVFVGVQVRDGVGVNVRVGEGVNVGPDRVDVGAGSVAVMMTVTSTVTVWIGSCVMIHPLTAAP